MAKIPWSCILYRLKFSTDLLILFIVVNRARIHYLYVVLPTLENSVADVYFFCQFLGSIRITRHNAQELIVAADMLQLTDLVSGCVDFFIKELDITNAVGIYRYLQLIISIIFNPLS